MDDFSGGVTVDRPMQLVLHSLEKGLRDLGVRIIVDARGIDVGDLLVKQPLGVADVADAGKQFLEVVLSDGSPCLDAFVVEHEAFDQKLSQLGGRPLAVLRAARRTNPVAHGKDHVKVVVGHGSFDRPPALCLNY